MNDNPFPKNKKLKELSKSIQIFSKEIKKFEYPLNYSKKIFQSLQKENFVLRDFEKLQKIIDNSNLINKKILNQLSASKLFSKELPELNHKAKKIESIIKIQSEKSKLMLKTMENVIPKINLIDESVSKTLKSLNLINSDLFKSIEKYQRTFIPIFDSKTIERLTKKAKEMNSDEFKQFYKEWGWLLNNKSASFGDYCFGLFKKYGESGFKNIINRWFYHKKNVNIVLKDIKKKSPNRYEIISEAFKYHLSKKYDLSITLLLPHTEGLLWELGIKKRFVRKGYNSKKKYKKYFTCNDLEKLEKENKWAFWELHEISKILFPNNRLHNIIVTEIFCEGPRNKILHGRNVYNGKTKEISRWKSTLLILTLWRLSDEF